MSLLFFFFSLSLTSLINSGSPGETCDCPRPNDCDLLGCPCALCSLSSNIGYGCCSDGRTCYIQSDGVTCGCIAPQAICSLNNNDISTTNDPSITDPSDYSCQTCEFGYNNGNKECVCDNNGNEICEYVIANVLTQVFCRKTCETVGDDCPLLFCPESQCPNDQTISYGCTGQCYLTENNICSGLLLYLIYPFID